MWWLFRSFLREHLRSSSLTRFCWGWGFLQHHNDCSIRNAPELRSLRWDHLWKRRNSDSNPSEVRSHTYTHWLLPGKHSKIFDYRPTNSTQIKTQNQQKNPKPQHIQPQQHTCTPFLITTTHLRYVLLFALEVCSQIPLICCTHGYQRLSAPNTKFFNLGRCWIPAKMRF